MTTNPFKGYGNLTGMTLSEEVEHRSKERTKQIIASRKREQMLMDYHARMDSNSFSIEPMPSEWARVAKPMTPEERFLRKQFLQDQILSPNEPRYVPEANPKNVFRRGWHTFFNTMSRPVVKLCVSWSFFACICKSVKGECTSQFSCLLVTFTVIQVLELYAR